MALDTALTRMLGIEHPLIQGPMAGGTSTPAMAAAASAAGALGSIGAAYLSAEQILAAAADIRKLTDKPFAVNLFAPGGAVDAPDDFEPALQVVRAAHSRLGLTPPAMPQREPDPFPAQFDAVLQSGAAVFSFTFGVVPAAAIAAARARGMAVIGTATTVEEARALERAGVDAVVAQGSEAGGHRGSFASPFEAAMIGTMALVPQVADAVKIPVIASGGIMDGRGLAAALALGAAGVQMGTAFLTATESGAPQPHKAAVLAAAETQTRITRAFSGRPARGIENHFMREAERADRPGAILPYPLQNSLTRAMRTAAGQQGRAEFLSLWSGQAPRLARSAGAAEIVGMVMRQAEDVLRRLPG